MVFRQRVCLASITVFTLESKALVSGKTLLVMARLKTASRGLGFAVNPLLIFALFLVINLSPSVGEAAAGLSLQEAIEHGFSANPEISRAVNTQKAVEEQLKQAREFYLPSVSLEAQGGYESTTTPVIDEEELNRRRVSLTLTQLLFNGFETVNEVRKRQARKDSAEYNSVKAAELTALNITDGFLSVLRRRALLDEAKKSVDDHRVIFEKIKDGANNGKFNQGDLAQARSRLARARAGLDVAQQNLAEAEASYLRSVGALPPPDMIVPDFPAEILPKTVEEFIAAAKNSSPALATFRADLKAAEADYHGKKSNFLPEVSLQVSGTRGLDVGGIEGSEESGSALVVARWDLFRGGADVARMQEAYYRKAAAGDDQLDAERVLENDIRKAWAARRSAFAQLEEFRRQVRANTKVFEVYRDQFQLNRRTLLDLLNAQNELFVSKSNQINLFYSALFSGYQLLALRGDLAPTLRPGKAAKAIKEPVSADAGAEEMKKQALAVVPEAGEAAPAPVKTAHKAEKTVIPSVAARAVPKSRLVQLGAYRTLPELEERWKMLMESGADLLQGAEKLIQHVDLGKEGVYYRLRVGPVTKSAGRALCKELGERNLGGCIIVKP